MSKLEHFTYVLLLIFKTAYSNDSLEDNAIVTTAILPKYVSPKPTTLYRRINVERKLDEGSSTQVDLFRFVEARRKKGKSSIIWKWDFWCQLQPKRGSCGKKLDRYFYDAQLGVCLPFVYSGCDGNKNNFETNVDCEQHCSGANFMHIKETTKPIYCYLQRNTGYCLALFKKYYYDINERTCKVFTYGGCGGNQNKFDTMFDCMRVCGDED